MQAFFKLISLIAVLLVGLLAALPLLRNEESRPIDDAARAVAPGQFIELQHGTVHYRLEGSENAPLVVLIHGFSVPSYTWENNAQFLVENGFRVLSYDQYGRGYSDRPETSYDRKLFVGQLRELLDELDIHQQVHVVGLSMGGAIAAAFAADYPGRVLTVAFIAPFNTPVDIGPMMTPVLGEYIAYSFYVPGMAESQLNDFVAPAGRQAWVRQFSEQMQYDGFRNAILSTARHFLQDDPIWDFQSIAAEYIPALLLWGDSDTVFPPEVAERVRTALGEMHRFHLVEAGGHAMHYEKPDVINPLLLEFLRESG